MDLGRRLKHFREMEGLSQKDAAEKIGVKGYQLANYENNRSEPNIATLKNMSKVYNVSIDGLVGNMSKKPRKLSEDKYVDMDELIDNLNEIVELINKNKSKI